MIDILKKISLTILLIYALFLPIPAFALMEGERIASLFEEQADSVVLIAAAQKNDQENKLGSGFVVSEDGLIVTNAHLVSQVDKIIVKLRNNRAYRHVRVVAVDEEKDIAVLKINAQGLKAVKVGNSKHVEIGQRVVTIGNPLGFEGTVSDGLISSLREGNKGFRIFQTSVPLSNGSSGGPLFDLKGKVIGITTASHLKGQNLNFAVPINYVKPLLRRVRRQTDHAVDFPKRSYKRLTKKFFQPVMPLALKEKIEPEFYTVQPGDTLYGIAQRFDKSMEEIRVRNQLNTSTIRVGQRLRMSE